MRKKLWCMSTFVCFVLVIAGCSSKMTEASYIDFVNISLDQSDDAFEQLQLKLYGSVNGDYSSLKKTAGNLNQIDTAAIQKFEKTQPPEKFKQEHTVLINMLKAEEEYSNAVKMYGETGDKKILLDSANSLESMIKYFNDSMFSKKEYRVSKNSETINYNLSLNVIKQVDSMKESDYLIAIKDRIDNFYVYIKSLKELMSMAGVINIKDGADTLYNGLALLLQSINSMKPPQKYQTEHKGFVQTVQYAYSAADNLRKYSRSPNNDIAKNLNDTITQLGNSMSSVSSLQKDVQTNLK